MLAIRFNPESKQRTLDALRWGLIPHWAKDPKIAYKTINARAETVDTAPSYRQAFKKRRCLIPVDGFYEWEKVLGVKIPYSIQMKDDAPFVFAWLWEGWKDPGTDKWLGDFRIFIVRIVNLNTVCREPVRTNIVNSLSVRRARTQRKCGSFRARYLVVKRAN